MANLDTVALPADGRNQLVLLDVDSSAVAANRGFYVQYLETVEEWVASYGTSRRVYCEVHDDISTYDPETERRTFHQVKSYHSKPLGINDDAIAHTLYLFYRNAIKHPLDKCSFTLVIDGALRPTETLLSDWANGRPTGPQGVQLLRTVIHQRLTQRYAKIISVNSVSTAAQQQAWAVELETFRRFDFGQFSKRIMVEVAFTSVKERVERLHRTVRDFLQAEAPVSVVLARCLQAVIEAASAHKPEDRVLTSEGLRSLRDESAAAMVSHTRVLDFVAALDRCRETVQDGFESLHKRFDQLTDVRRPEVSQPLIARAVGLLRDALVQDQPQQRPIGLPLDIVEKLILNRLSDAIRTRIADGMQYHDQVDAIFQGDTFKRSEKEFIQRRMGSYYVRLRSPGSCPDDIYWALVDTITPPAADEALSWACEIIITWFFVGCEVFERAPNEVRRRF